jgi:hypothetical protein
VFGLALHILDAKYLRAWATSQYEGKGRWKGQGGSNTLSTHLLPRTATGLLPTRVFVTVMLSYKYTPRDDPILHPRIVTECLNRPCDYLYNWQKSAKSIFPTETSENEWRIRLSQNPTEPVTNGCGVQGQKTTNCVTFAIAARYREGIRPVLRNLSILAAHWILSKSHGGTPTPFCILFGGREMVYGIDWPRQLLINRPQPKNVLFDVHNYPSLLLRHLF